MGSTRRVVAAMAFATGAVVANLYYAQPLENTLAAAFHASTGAVGLVITLIQIGYAIGLATLVPLGDLLERRKLLVTLLVVAAAGLVLMTVAPSLAVFGSAAVLVGITSVAVQIVVPFAAHLAEEGQQGRVVGTVMSGLLIGILISRTVAGLVAQAASWRAVFALGAVLTAAVAVLLWRELPKLAPSVRMTYPALLGSVLRLVREEPTLRMRMVYGGLMFASFSVFWTSSGFLLARTYHYNDAAIGAFALVGAAGAVMARFAGKLADRGHARRRHRRVHRAGRAVLPADRARRTFDRRADHRRDPARPRRAGHPDQQPEPDLHAARGRPQPVEHRLHDRVLRGRRDRQRSVRGGLLLRRLERGVLARRRVPGAGRADLGGRDAGATPPVFRSRRSSRNRSPQPRRLGDPPGPPGSEPRSSIPGPWPSTRCILTLSKRRLPTSTMFGSRPLTWNPKLLVQLQRAVVVATHAQHEGFQVGAARVARSAPRPPRGRGRGPARPDGPSSSAPRRCAACSRTAAGASSRTPRSDRPLWPVRTRRHPGRRLPAARPATHPKSPGRVDSRSQQRHRRRPRRAARGARPRSARRRILGPVEFDVHRPTA